MERDALERKILLLLDKLDELTEYVTEETIYLALECLNEIERDMEELKNTL